MAIEEGLDVLVVVQPHRTNPVLHERAVADYQLQTEGQVLKVLLNREGNGERYQPT